jgi:hypothetical protein
MWALDITNGGEKWNETFVSPPWSGEKALVLSVFFGIWMKRFTHP